MSILEDRVLLYRLRHGDGDALRRVYEKYSMAMVSVAASMVADVSVAEDIMQDAFVGFAQRAADGGIRSNLKAYLMTTVVNKVRNRFRQMSYKAAPGRLGDVDVADGGPEAGEVAETAEEVGRLREAMRELPDEIREVIVLRIHGRMRFEQIAAVQESNANTARTRYKRGIEKLRKIMEERGQGPGARGQEERRKSQNR